MKILRTLGLICFAAGFAGLAAKDAPAAPRKPPTDFRALDTNNDGKISLAEFTAPAAKQREAGRATEKGGAKPEDKKPKHDEIVSAADSVEGRYSPEVFALLDVNHDNSLSPAELAVLFADAHNISQP